jgi:Calcineurin-like phosphoesterase superfamily domain
MRVAVFSDIHGNAVALDAVLADCEARGAERLLCLGDAVQGGPQPVEVVARLRALGCPVVMGNADAWLLSGEETGSEQIDPERLRQMEAMRLWSLSRLTADDRAFITAFHPTVELPLGDGRSLLGFHGSPVSFDDIIVPATPDEQVRRLLGPYLPRILAGAHTHIQQLRQLGPSFYFGCGSVGRAYRHDQAATPWLRYDPWAEYALLTVEGGATGLELRRVPYDIAALVEVYEASGCPYAEQAIAQYC